MQWTAPATDLAMCQSAVALAHGASGASVAIDGSKFKAVNNRDRSFTAAKMKRRMAQIEESVGRYLHQLDSADRQKPSLAQTMKTTRMTEKIERLKAEMGRLEALEAGITVTLFGKPRCDFAGDFIKSLFPRTQGQRMLDLFHGYLGPRLWPDRSPARI